MIFSEACEVCNDEAVVMTNDLEEGKPEPDDDGNLWATWKVTGKHFRCSKHPYQAFWEHNESGKQVYRAAPALA